MIFYSISIYFIVSQQTIERISRHIVFYAKWPKIENKAEHGA